MNPSAPWGSMAKWLALSPRGNKVQDKGCRNISGRRPGNMGQNGWKREQFSVFKAPRNGGRGSLAPNNGTAAPAIMSELTSRRQQRSISPGSAVLHSQKPLTPTLQSHGCLFVAGFLFKNSKENLCSLKLFQFFWGRVAFNITWRPFEFTSCRGIAIK